MTGDEQMFEVSGPRLRELAASVVAAGDRAGLYLDLLKRTLTGMVWQDPPITSPWWPTSTYQEDQRIIGIDWPQHAPCMIGPIRLSNVQDCVETILTDGVPGDLAECGVWRGGTCMFMRALLKVYGVTGRDVWVMDSFAGLPPDGMLREGFTGPEQHRLAVPLEEVRANFARFGLLDDRVRFWPGWFSESLPAAPVGELALLRMDADLRSSTLDILTNLYPKVVPGGFVIVDDWTLPARQATEEYRAEHGIDDPILPVEGALFNGGPLSVFWRKTG